MTDLLKIVNESQPAEVLLKGLKDDNMSVSLAAAFTSRLRLAAEYFSTRSTKRADRRSTII